MRLSVMQPTKQSVETYLANNEPKISPGVPELFDALRANGKTVYLVSGGFRQMIAPVARAGRPAREHLRQQHPVQRGRIVQVVRPGRVHQQGWG